MVHPAPPAGGALPEGGRLLVDGAPVDPAWIDDRACQFGDGLFETIAVVAGLPCLWDAHVDRLREGCHRLGLPLPDLAAWRREVVDCCRPCARAVLKLYWTAGPSLRGYRRAQPPRPRRIVRLLPWAEDHRLSRPWRGRYCRHRLSESPALAGIKHLNRLDQVLARAEWDDERVDEGITLGQDGRVVCGTASNLFACFGDRMVTPALDSAGVAGVVRRAVLEEARRQQAEVAVETVTPARLARADSVYLTSSLIGVVRLQSIDDTGYDVTRPWHPVMARVRQTCHDPAA